MGDVELVIKIPHQIYELSQMLDVKHKDVIQIPLECIANGILLPKGHGDLIDRNSIEYLKTCHDVQWDGLELSKAVKKVKHSASTIVPADRKDDRTLCEPIQEEKRNCPYYSEAKGINSDEVIFVRCDKSHQGNPFECKGIKQNCSLDIT